MKKIGEKRCVALALSLSIIVLNFWACEAMAGVTAKVTREVLGKIVTRSGKEAAEKGMKKGLLEVVERLGRTYGDDVILKIIREGGEEALEAVVKYGDDAIQIFRSSSPAAQRALARSLPELLPLARRVGVGALELEAKAPGLALDVFRIFGDDVGKAVAKGAPLKDLPRLLQYAEKADSPATRDVLWRLYQKQKQKDGISKLLDHLPRLIVAGGLTTAMVYTAYRATEPYAADAEMLREDGKNGGERADRRWRYSANLTAGILLVIAFVLLWRFRLLPWHGKRHASYASSEKITKIQPPELRASMNKK